MNIITGIRNCFMYWDIYYEVYCNRNTHEDNSQKDAWKSEYSVKRNVFSLISSGTKL